MDIDLSLLLWDDVSGGYWVQEADTPFTMADYFTLSNNIIHRCGCNENTGQILLKIHRSYFHPCWTSH
jgi:hypothetical protein